MTDRCPDCDLPIATQTDDAHPEDTGLCWRNQWGGICPEVRVDWRARAMTAEAELERLRALATISPEDIKAAVTENDRLRKAFSDLIAKLTTGSTLNYLTCTYCGKNQLREDHEGADDVKRIATEHARQCAEHPLRQERDRLHATIRALVTHLGVDSIDDIVPLMNFMRSVVESVGQWIAEGGSMGAVIDAYGEYEGSKL